MSTYPLTTERAYEPEPQRGSFPSAYPESPVKTADLVLIKELDLPNAGPSAGVPYSTMIYDETSVTHGCLYGYDDRGLAAILAPGYWVTVRRFDSRADAERAAAVMQREYGIA